MLPLFDDNPTRRFPLVTVLLIAANVAIWLYMVTLSTDPMRVGRYMVDARTLFVFRYALVPWELVNGRELQSSMDVGINKNIYLPLFSAMFLHADWLHIGGNMLFLWVFGNNVEDLMGRPAFLGFYLICGLGGTVGHVLFNTTSQAPLLGASGAIAGVLAAYLIMYPRARVHTLVFILIISVPAYVVLGFWIVLQAVSGITSLQTASDVGVAWFAHLGGVAVGIVITGIFYAPLRRRRGADVTAELHGGYRRDEYGADSEDGNPLDPYRR
ncbi:MAG: rhomboid family intramembrane serine protease [Candidatus Geothermincolia bacterium]